MVLTTVLPNPHNTEKMAFLKLIGICLCPELGTRGGCCLQHLWLPALSVRDSRTTPSLRHQRGTSGHLENGGWRVNICTVQTLNNRSYWSSKTHSHTHIHTCTNTHPRYGSSRIPFDYRRPNCELRQKVSSQGTALGHCVETQVFLFSNGRGWWVVRAGSCARTWLSRPGRRQTQS